MTEKEQIGLIVKGLNKSILEYFNHMGYTSSCFIENGEVAMNEMAGVKEGRKYYAINIGNSGAFLAEKGSGELFNIKAYGVPDKNKKRKANLGTIWNVNIEELYSRRYNYLR